MCRFYTVRGVVLTLLSAFSCWGQSRTEWRHVGTGAIEIGLASPAGGRVRQVWFSPSGSTVYALTGTGKTFQTADFQTWAEAQDGSAPADRNINPITPSRVPEPGVALQSSPDGRTLYALGKNVYRSDDGGRTWQSLTAFKSTSVIGGGQRSIAVSPGDSDQIVVANDFGVWRSMDGGMTWSGSNEQLPNLAVRRIVSTPTSTAGARIEVENIPATLELRPGAEVWSPAAFGENSEQALKSRYSLQFGAAAQAVAVSGDAIYVGLADGRIFFSNDGGAAFYQSDLPPKTAGVVERFWIDPRDSRSAVAALAGSGVHVLHTFSGGLFWDAMDSNLPDASAHSIVADPESGAVYVATDRGVFWTTMDLLGSSTPRDWSDVSVGLPKAPVYDVALDPAGFQLYAALEGYGVYATASPHRARRLRVVSAADYTARAAAPGSLLSVMGAQVTSARGNSVDYPILGLPSETESQIQVPFGATGPSVSLALTTTSGLVTLPLELQTTSPAIFSWTDGSPMLYDADSGLPIDGRNPAHSNGRIQIFATGLGKTDPEIRAGMPTPLQNPPAVVADIKAYLNGAPLQVTRATLAPGYVGFYLVEAKLPVIANFGSSVLYISADGRSSNRVQVVIDPGTR